MLIIGIFAAISSCKLLDKLTQFNMEFNQEVSIPSSTVINLPINIETEDTETNSETTFEINDTKKDLVEEILLKQIDLTITSPSNKNFDFLKSVSIYISAEGLEELKVAWLDEVPDNVGNTLDLEKTNSDLKEYIKKDEFKLRLNTTTDQIITTNYDINIHTIFKVDANILGI
ncbi:MAG: hypothetical protein KDC90_19295 [Ignavibacteriae bacterium]|nr:hypothetical protein [Ignavibacteriota bacterium]